MLESAVLHELVKVRGSLPRRACRHFAENTTPYKVFWGEIPNHNSGTAWTLTACSCGAGTRARQDRAAGGGSWRADGRAQHGAGFARRGGVGVAQQAPATSACSCGGSVSGGPGPTRLWSPLARTEQCAGMSGRAAQLCAVRRTTARSHTPLTGACGDDGGTRGHVRRARPGVRRAREDLAPSCLRG